MHFGDDDGTKTILEDKILELNSNFSKTTNDSESSSASNENGKVDNDDIWKLRLLKMKRKKKAVSI